MRIPAPYGARRLHPIPALVLFAALVGATPPTAARAPENPPYERTESLEPCSDYDPNKQAFFGSTHVHTSRSFDASLNLVPATPRQAYAFAKGEGIVPGVDRHGWVTRKYCMNRRADPTCPNDFPPLDWGTVTDHSEYFGAVGICQDHDNKPKGYYSLDCQLLRGFYIRPHEEGQQGSGAPPPLQQELAGTAFALLGSAVLGPSSRNIPLPVCNEGHCEVAELGVWQEMQHAAHEAYDPCHFTSFIGYEATSVPLGTTWHRNVIFRNHHVVDRPVTAIDMAREDNPDPKNVSPQWLGPQDPEKLWDRLDERCQPPCEALTIPHNSNLGGGVQSPEGLPLVPPAFFDPPTQEFAEKRQYWEPLVEIYQTKGSSECRWDPRLGQGVETTDEHCDFELLDAAAGSAVSQDPVVSLAPYPPRSWVRNILKDGLKFLQDPRYGVNPFKLGIVASNDTHNGTMGWHPENATLRGHAGIKDAVPTRSPTLQNSSGGHSVVWAEENTRDSIFSALRRRETYGTSGPRIQARFFGGWEYPEDACARDFVSLGYDQGVPMGGDLRPRVGTEGPRFITAAWRDEHQQTPLQQIQIIKGWVDAQGETHEMVYTVAGGDNGAGVDKQCQLTGPGHERLCATWQDEDFDPSVPAFYYVRVLENPVCRYTTHLCQQDFEVNPLDEDCKEQLRVLGRENPRKAADAAFCCSNETTLPIVQPVIQERAWTSPIWYTPGADLHLSAGGD